MTKFSPFVCLCLALCCSTSLVSAKRFRWWYHWTAEQETQVTYSPELVQDLREFIKLIPQVEVDAVVAEHMLIDSDFRKAIKYLRSSEFKQLLDRMQLLPEVIEVINYLHLNDTAVRTITRLQLSNRADSQQQLQREDVRDLGYFISDKSANSSYSEGVVVVLLPQLPPIQQKPANLHTFLSFVRELLSHLPRDRFVSLINEKRKTGTKFPKFYEALRSDQFKGIVENAMKSPNVANMISTLASHNIDAEGLKTVAFDVISWGPPL